MKPEDFNIAPYIEHTLLKPGIRGEDVRKLCLEAEEAEFFAVCIPPYWVKKAKEFLRKSSVKVCTVVGFPFGYQHPNVKLFETRQALADGADEIDAVMNISAFKNKLFGEVAEELTALVTEVRKYNKVLKVIIETAFLDFSETEIICRICEEAGVHGVKTSTGYAERGAEEETVRFLRDVLPEPIFIKASGGIADFEKAFACIRAGAARIGTSHGMKLLCHA